MSTLFSVEWWAECWNDELEGMQQVAVVICFRKLSQYLPGGTDVKVASWLRRLVATQARSEASLCGIFSEQSGSVTGFFRVLGFRLSSIPLRFDTHRPMPFVYPRCGADLGTVSILNP